MHFVRARFFQKANRGVGDITLVCIHTAECGETTKAAENLASWGGGSNANKASWHYAVDSDSVTQSVEEKDIAWHAGPVNGFSIGVEHAGYARQTAEEWADAFSIATLERSAELVGGICERYDIPIRRLSAEQLKAGERRGICGHVDVTNGLTGGKGHTDPGRHFPWEWYLDRVRAYAGAELPPAALTPEQAASGSKDIDFAQWAVVECEGIVWEVCPIYIAPVGIGQARELAEAAGCELPSPALVDAIWKAADLKIDATLMTRTHDGTPKTMDSAETHIDQARRLATIVGERSLGKDFRLLAGAYKDVVVHGGRLGLYGWHRLNGTVIQTFFAGHAPAWRDYSQGLRLVRRRS